VRPPPRTTLSKLACKASFRLLVTSEQPSESWPRLKNVRSVQCKRSWTRPRSSENQRRVHSSTASHSRPRYLPLQMLSSRSIVSLRGLLRSFYDGDGVADAVDRANHFVRRAELREVPLNHSQSVIPSECTAMAASVSSSTFDQLGRLHTPTGTFR
jgi:hypothetical protein